MTIVSFCRGEAQANCAQPEVIFAISRRACAYSRRQQQCVLERITRAHRIPVVQQVAAQVSSTPPAAPQPGSGSAPLRSASKAATACRSFGSARSLLPA